MRMYPFFTPEAMDSRSEILVIVESVCAFAIMPILSIASKIKDFFIVCLSF
jgi:hypothetical protein